MQSRQDAFTNGSRISGRVEGSAEIGMLSALSQLTPSSEPARSTRVVRHVSAFSTAPMTPALCGRRHFLPFWSAGARLSPGGLTGTWGIEVPEHRLAKSRTLPSGSATLPSCCGCCWEHKASVCSICSHTTAPAAGRLLHQCL